MDSNSNSLVRDFEISLIKNEANFYLEFMLNFIQTKSSGVLIFELLPYLSLFTVESSNYIQSCLPNYAEEISREYERVIRNSRMRIKFFDDTNNRVDGMFELIDWISQFYEDWFINSHTSSIKRDLQPDFGIFAYDGHIIGSTHMSFLFTGLGKEDISPNGEETGEIMGKILHSVAQEMGAYLGCLNTYPEFMFTETNSFVYNIEDDKLGYKDVKSKEFFGCVFNKNHTIAINFSLVLFLATINFFRYILNRLFDKSPEILFKLKFIMLYHIVSSLQKLQDYCYPKNLLSEQSKEYLKDILKSKELKKLTRKDLRNILVHYKLEKVPPDLIDQGFDLKNLVEYFFPSQRFEEIDQKINDQIIHISDILEQWLNWNVKSSQFSKW
ncbi:MAG: hypothetical protein F6K62_00150 [Sphaerospermopsis sp. SIO1G2]|nr:hypothetical protein [Sphaerospermopsis sp. SIO1G2]